MKDTSALQLSQLLDAASAPTVLREAGRLFAHHYGAAGFRPVRHAAGLVERLFAGRFPGYRACNTEYHDLAHTLGVLLAAARLLDGHALARGGRSALPGGDHLTPSMARGPLPAVIAVNVLLAALLHDTGYLQRRDDEQGTGAKYTRTHVERSIRLTLTYAVDLEIPPAQAEVVGRLISGTDLDRSGQDLFHSEEEKIAGAILASADLLGQMSDRTYLEKLIFLYKELQEAGIGDYRTEFDILRSTLGFYRIVRERLDGPLMGVYKEASLHFEKRFAISRNLYTEAIERQMEYLEEIIEDNTTNFRKKLKRMDLEKYGSARPA